MSHSLKSFTKEAIQKKININKKSGGFNVSSSEIEKYMPKYTLLYSDTWIKEIEIFFYNVTDTPRNSAEKSMNMKICKYVAVFVPDTWTLTTRDPCVPLLFENKFNLIYCAWFVFYQRVKSHSAHFAYCSDSIYF